MSIYSYMIIKKAKELVKKTKSLLKVVKQSNMNNPCTNLIKILNNQKNKKKMQHCFYNILKISHIFPPAKNENKFIYGKLIELELIKTINTFISCEELDKNHASGSEYKNDCIIKNNKFSIKASKNTSNVIVTNKFNKLNYNIHTNFIICNITKQKLYIFPSIIIDKKYIVDSNSNIYFKSSVFKHIEENNKDFVYNFPVNNQNLSKIQKIKTIDIYDYLYKIFIK